MYRFTQEISVSLTMIALHSLPLWSIVTIHPLARAGTIVLNPYNVISHESFSQISNESTVGVNSDTHCTHDPAWLASSSQSGSGKDYWGTRGNATADAAWNVIQSIRLETSQHQDTTSELLDRGAIPHTSMLQRVSQLPNKAYCTVAFAFINSIEAGAPP